MVKSEKYETKRFTIEKLVDDENDGVVVNITVGKLEFFFKEVSEENKSLNNDEIIGLCVEKVYTFNPTEFENFICNNI